MSVQVHQLTEVIEEAERFLRLAKQAKDVLILDRAANGYKESNGCKETAAVKRASLDLSNALSNLRGRNKPRR